MERYIPIAGINPPLGLLWDAQYRMEALYGQNYEMTSDETSLSRTKLRSVTACVDPSETKYSAKFTQMRTLASDCLAADPGPLAAKKD